MRVAIEIILIKSKDNIKEKNEIFIKKIKQMKEKENTEKSKNINTIDNENKINFNNFDLENFLKNESKKLKGKYGDEFGKDNKTGNKTTIDTIDLDGNATIDHLRENMNVKGITKKNKIINNNNINLNDNSKIKNNYNNRIYNIKIDLSGLINDNKLLNARYQNNNKSLSPVSRNNIYNSTKTKYNNNNSKKVQLDQNKIDKMTGFYKDDIKYDEKKIKKSDKLFIEKVKTENKLRQNNMNIYRTYTTQK